MATMETGIGAPVLRKEDERFLTGGACFGDDIQPDGVLAAVVLRSPVAHAEIRLVDTEAARSAPGVKLVLLAADLEAHGVQPNPSYSTTPPFDVGRLDGGDAADLSQYPLARDRVRYAGEPVAFVVADTVEKAQNAAELIEIDYADLPVVMEIEDALVPSAEQLWPDAPKMPATEPLTALSRLASSKTMKGDLPPNSSETAAKLFAVFRTTWAAAFGPPVKATRATSG